MCLPCVLVTDDYSVINMAKTKIITVGRDKYILIPEQMLLRVGMDDQVAIEERDGGIFLHAHASRKGLLTWQETYRAMAEDEEDWSDWVNCDE